MQAKDWLENIKYIEEEIQSLRHEQDRLIGKGLVSAPPSPFKSFVVSSSGNPMEWRNIEYAGYSELIDEKIRKLFELKTDVHNAIENIPQITYRILLREHYINRKGFTAIAHILHYSYDYVVKDLHPAALGAIVVPDKYR